MTLSPTTVIVQKKVLNQYNISLCGHIDPDLGPKIPDPGTMYFIIQAEDFMAVITMHLSFLKYMLYKSREYDFLRFKTFSQQGFIGLALGLESPPRDNEFHSLGKGLKKIRIMNLLFLKYAWK